MTSLDSLFRRRRTFGWWWRRLRTFLVLSHCSWWGFRWLFCSHYYTPIHNIKKLFFRIPWWRRWRTFGWSLNSLVSPWRTRWCRWRFWRCLSCSHIFLHSGYRVLFLTNLFLHFFLFSFCF